MYRLLVTAGLCLAAGCASAGDLTSGTTAGFIVQSHRGAGLLAPENTLEAFELGWQLGTYPEADIRTTTDGVIVTFHDANFKRVVKDVPAHLEKKGVADVTWKELSELEVGDTIDGKWVGHAVPKLADVLRLMKGRPERNLYLDIKNVNFDDLARLVKEHGVAEQVILSTPRINETREWRRLVPNGQTLLWLGGKVDDITSKYNAARSSDFADITQIQVHAHLKLPADQITQDTPDPFEVPDEFIRSVAAEITPRGILFQSLPFGGSSQGVYMKLLALGVKSLATDHPRTTLQVVRQYVSQGKDQRDNSKN